MGLHGVSGLQARENAAGCLWRLVSMMNESNIEVNISTKKASDLVVLLHTASAEGKEAAAGKCLCATNVLHKRSTWCPLCHQCVSLGALCVTNV
jgi:hypothetical protein